MGDWPPRVRGMVYLAVFAFLLACGHSLWTEVISDWFK